MSDDSSSSASSRAAQQSRGPAGLFSGLRLISLCTLVSRVLGLIRDASMAAVFGNGPILDAFTVAFRIPNLARRLFGEGALSAAFLPIFVREVQEHSEQSAWKLASALFSVLAMGLCGVVLVAELGLCCVHWLLPVGDEATLLIGLTAVMLPYLLLICLAAQVSAVLHALEHFAWPALLPVLLNIVWIAAIWLLAPLFATKTAQVYAIAVCIVLAGVAQLVAPLPTLRRLGFVFDRAWRSAESRVVEIARSMLPIVIGLSITQLNTLLDSLIAWGLAQPTDGPQRMNWFGQPEFPFLAGTASALYFGQRLYQFPLGVFGIALGTVLYPRMSQHAGKGRLDQLCDDLSLGMRLVICIGLPASLGLVLLAEPLIVLLFQYREFDAADVQQTVAMTMAYGTAVWAYCGLLIIHRAFYAAGDRQTPLRVGLWAMALNLVLNMTLIWYLGGSGLATATAITAMVQVVIVAWLAQKRLGSIDWRPVRRTTLRVAVATAIMGLVCVVSRDWLGPAETISQRFVAVAVPFVASLGTFFLLARLLAIADIWLLFRRDVRSSGTDVEE